MDIHSGEVDRDIFQFQSREAFPLLPSLLLLPTKHWFSFCQPSVLFSESEPERGGWRRPCADGSDQGQLGPGPEHGSAQSGTSGLHFSPVNSHHLLSFPLLHNIAHFEHIASTQKWKGRRGLWIFKLASPF